MRVPMSAEDNRLYVLMLKTRDATQQLVATLERQQAERMEALAMAGRLLNDSTAEYRRMLLTMHRIRRAKNIHAARVIVEDFLQSVA